MKLLLDESMPRRLAASFPAPFTTRTVQEMGWTGTANGLLLSLVPQVVDVLSNDPEARIYRASE